MKDTALYEHLLALQTPWSVKSVDLSLADQRVVVEVVLKQGQVWADPTDGRVEELAVPWAERYSRVTLLMEAFVVKLLQACPTTQGVCELTRLAWSTVNGIMVSAVEQGMLRRNEDDVPHLGLDEKSSERGHTYASILTDIDRSRVLDLVPERKLEAAKSLLETLSPTQRASAKAVAKDMRPAFMSAAQTCLPQADIVHDRFHVSKYRGYPEFCVNGISSLLRHPVHELDSKPV